MPEPVRLVGLTKQFRPVAGDIVVPSVTVPAKPLFAVSVMVVAPAAPWSMFTEFGLEDREKSVTVKVMV